MSLPSVDRETKVISAILFITALSLVGAYYLDRQYFVDWSDVERIAEYDQEAARASPDLSLLELRLQSDEEEYCLGDTANVSIYLANPSVYPILVDTSTPISFHGEAEVQIGVVEVGVPYNSDADQLIIELSSENVIGTISTIPWEQGLFTFYAELGPLSANYTVQILEPNATKYYTYSNLTVTPETLELGENATISFEFTNILRRKADFAYAIHVESPDNSYEIMGGTSMEGYETKTLSHIETPDVIGMYIVSVGELEVYFSVVSSGDPVKDN